MKLSRRHALALPIIAFGLAGTGCAASSDYMHEAHAPQFMHPVGNAATVVFIRPSGFAKAMKMTVLDGRGRFLGDSLPESWFAVKMPPGEHVFVGWAENTSALRAQLLPGRTYYVEVAPKMGAWSARVHLLAITPRSESWGELREWLDESQQLVPDEVGGQAYLNGRKDDVVDRLQRASETIREYDRDELEERTLRPEDGLAVAPAVAAPR
jgi:hypothetical protein